jgi:prepilin-type N-terminal cleavage/methylation domain-containing protein
MTPQYDRTPSEKGFSLIELMIYLVLFLVILTTLYQMLDSNRATYASGERKMDVQQNARVSMDEITRQLRMAGFYSENFDDPTANDLATPSPIHVATDDALAVFGDADNSDSSSVFMFCLDGTTLRRGKGADAVAASYTCGNGEVLGENVTNLRFTYYDEDSATVPADPAPPFQLDDQAAGAAPDMSDLTERDSVRRVVIEITVSDDVPGQGNQTYTLTSDVRLRNIN